MSSEWAVVGFCVCRLIFIVTEKWNFSSRAKGDNRTIGRVYLQLIALAGLVSGEVRAVVMKVKRKSRGLRRRAVIASCQYVMARQRKRLFSKTHH